MKVVIGMATIRGRENTLKQTLKSLEGQYDEMHVYNNDKEEIDYSDNAKFKALERYKEPIYFLSCDDDLIYPPNYVKDMVKAIDNHKTIVTHHGRILIGLNKNYYFGHKSFACLNYNNQNVKIDVAGTGVTGFRTDYFNPTEIYKSKFHRMSDLIFSYAAIKKGKEITVLPHPAGYIKQIPIPSSETIAGRESKSPVIQNEIANLIYQLK